MKTILIVLILLAIFFIFLNAKKSGKDAMHRSNSKNGNDTNPYQGLRAMVFNKAKDLGIEESKNSARACLMEMGLKWGSASLAMVADGGVSLYTSTGGGTIGAGGHESVRSPAKKYLTLSESYFPKMKKVESYPTPEDGEVYFYLVKKDEVYFYADKVENLINHKSEFSGLFSQGQEVLHELQQISGLEKRVLSIPPKGR